MELGGARKPLVRRLPELPAVLAGSDSRHETDPPVSDWHQYTAQLEIESDSDILRSAIDEVFTGLLRTLEARDVPEIEPYD